MSSPLPFPDRSVVASAEAAGFLALRDDHSVQISHRSDPKFWVRVETKPSDRIRVSDLTLGARTVSDAALALAQAVEMAEQSHVSAFQFLDIAPFPGDLEQRLQDLRAILGALAKARSRFVADWTVQSRDSKFDVFAAIDR